MPRMNLLAAVLLIAAVGLDSAAAQTAKTAIPAPVPAATAKSAAPAAAAKPVPAFAELASTLYIQTAERATIERLSTGDYKLTLHNPNPTTTWVTDRPLRKAGVVTNGDFFKFIGDTPKNPVNAALVNSPSDGKPGVAVPVKLYNGMYKDGKLSWTGQPLVSLSSIIAPGAKAAEKLKPGQSIEMKQPSLLIDGADGYKGPSVAARGRSGASDAFSTGRDTVNGALGDEEKAAAVDKDDVHGDVNARAEKWWSDNGRR